ncbi:hypothetical protein SERLA73DRAFT_80690 [Serpula lacrymans var. lacrymans S7.3]|uniref:Uncharacterized protein n=1 Tax=Serpula lacrymans var. lacrymans (strain S7.3) TaxID=936435 RepID=F8QK48_SERL3|nr:hypothetical protein SERLA73DRAFT_80962 [Serpula lacrymans var. lacrymans S7.3]EGN91322.1 hypothetical protein SERLA73DRAFT_80690 [Serpula lacrymans var. lacrymans S7.3]
MTTGRINQPPKEVHKKPPQQRSEFINLDRYQKAPPFQLRTANTCTEQASPV